MKKVTCTKRVGRRREEYGHFRVIKSGILFTARGKTYHRTYSCLVEGEAISMSCNVKVLVNQGNMLILQLHIELKNSSSQRSYAIPDMYEIRNSVRITFRLDEHCNQCAIFAKFCNVLDTDGKYMLKISSDGLTLEGKIYFTDSSEQYLGTMKGSFSFSPVIEIKMDLSPKANLLESLHDDTDLTDFVLIAKDGSVQFHKVVLAAWSPVLKSMFSNKWKETQDGKIELGSTTVKTLQHLKDYMYRQVLPETGLEELLQLASYYMVSDLKKRCMNRLLGSFTVRDVWELSEFVLANEMPTICEDFHQHLKKQKENDSK